MKVDGSKLMQKVVVRGSLHHIIYVTKHRVILCQAVDALADFFAFINKIYIKGLCGVLGENFVPKWTEKS